MAYINKIRYNDTDYNIAVPGITLNDDNKITSISMPTGSITCSTISTTNAEIETIEKVKVIKLVSNFYAPYNNFLQLGCKNKGSDIILEAQAVHVGTDEKVSNFDLIVKPDGKNYGITVPNKSGTLALTSDLDNIDLSTAAGTYYSSSATVNTEVCYIDKNGYVHYEHFKGQPITIPAGAVLLNVKWQG